MAKLTVAPFGRVISWVCKSTPSTGFSRSEASAISAWSSSAETVIGRMPFLKQLL